MEYSGDGAPHHNDHPNTFSDSVDLIGQALSVAAYLAWRRQNPASRVGQFWYDASMEIPEGKGRTDDKGRHFVSFADDFVRVYSIDNSIILTSGEATFDAVLSKKEIGGVDVVCCSMTGWCRRCDDYHQIEWSAFNRTDSLGFHLEGWFRPCDEDGRGNDF